MTASRHVLVGHIIPQKLDTMSAGNGGLFIYHIPPRRQNRTPHLTSGFVYLGIERGLLRWYDIYALDVCVTRQGSAPPETAARVGLFFVPE